jgi:hypothetical protein
VKKFRLLLLDANVVIEISRHGLWDGIVARCEVHLARTVIDEAQFFDDANGNRQYIDLTAYINAKSITVFDLTPSDLAMLRAEFDPVYFEKLDPGETESLGYLLRQSAESQICSADKIVYRVLGNLKRSEQGVSLEELLDQVGLGRKLPREFTRTYREEWTKKGFQEGLGGIGHQDNRA